MNEIEAEIDAEVVEILVANAQPVEYGEVLFRLRPMPRLTGEPAVFRKILIANRGEIALRIIWACRELGHQDGRGPLHRGRRRAPREVRRRGRLHRPAAEPRLVSQRVGGHLGGGDHRRRGHPPRLRLPRRVRAFRRGLPRVRPHVHRAGSRRDPPHGRQGRGAPHDDRGRASRPCPGATACSTDEATAQEVAERIGYPVLIKASAGGGGRGMRVVHARRGPRAPLRRRAPGGRSCVRRAGRLHGEVPAGAAAHRVPGPRRHPRQPGAPPRARVLDPAPASEAARGIALDGARRRHCARAWPRRRSARRGR